MQPFFFLSSRHYSYFTQTRPKLLLSTAINQIECALVTILLRPARYVLYTASIYIYIYKCVLPKLYYFHCIYLSGVEKGFSRRNHLLLFVDKAVRNLFYYKFELTVSSRIHTNRMTSL